MANVGEHGQGRGASSRGSSLDETTVRPRDADAKGGGGSLAETRTVAASGGSLAETMPRGSSDGDVGLDATKVARTNTWGDAPQGDLEVVRGALLGRYVALDRLGAGAMGVVYAAFDPELDRKVALKLLRPDPQSGGTSSQDRARLVREAQALAKLSHPNVVAIHDVGTLGQAVWIAMELVEGRTLREWLAERPHEWREVLAVMRPAGLGLAAAHAAGLVHRDVKPDNVMLSAEGRVRVMDFGLARGEAVAATEGRAGFGQGLLSVEMTQVGSLMGTPAYMASEQLRGEPAGPLADVYGFCVMLWEGLHGVRPFTGDTIEELRANVVAGKLTPPPATRKVPRWLVEVARRGLDADPGRRWPGMAELLAALERAQVRARRRGVLAGIAGGVTLAAAIVGGVAAWQRAQREAAIGRCEALGEQIEGVWGEAGRGRLRELLGPGGSTVADAAFERAVPWFDAWAAEWRRVRVTTCTLHEVERTWSADLRGRADECLEERQLEFGALLEVLANGDALASAIDAVTELPSASGCGEAEALARRPALPTDGLVALKELRSKLARVDALTVAGQYKEGLAVAAEALTEAEALAWPPAVAASQVQVGRLELQVGDRTKAAKVLEDGYFTASRAGTEAVAVKAASDLTELVGNRLARPEEGLRWARLAELGLVRLGIDGRPTLAAAQLYTARGMVRRFAGDYPGALADLQTTYDMEVALLGADHPNASDTAGKLAVVHQQLGDAAKEIEVMTAALAAQERVFGPDHPRVATVLNNLATARARTGEHDAAIELYNRTIAIYTRVFGPDSAKVAEALSNIAAVEHMRGDTEQAVALAQQAMAIRERANGPEHPAVASSLQNLGFMLLEAGRLDEAKVAIDRSIAIRRKVLGPEHPELAAVLGIRALIHRQQGELTEAWELYTQALAIREKALPAGHREILGNLRNLAQVAALRGDLTTARAYLERAKGLKPAELAEARLAVADAWWIKAPRERPEARQLAELAREGASKAKDRAAIDAWLATHLLP